MIRRAVSRATAMALCLALAVTFPSAGAASAQCRQALALGLDVSGSVDSREYRMQLGGLAAALRDPRVVRALLARPAPVHLAVFEWSAPGYQRLLLDWTAVTSPARLTEIARRLDATARAPSPPGTALGSAMQYGAALLARRPDCARRTLDISGDGKHNTGPHPRDMRRALSGGGITINALVIGADTRQDNDRRQVEISELSAYFTAWVITGPEAFVETALGFEDYEAAMVRKLLRELEGLVVSSLPARPEHP